MTSILGGMLDRSPYAPVLRHRAVRRFLPGFVLSSLGDGIAVVAVSWFALELAPVTDRAMWVALAAAAYTMPGAAGALLLGRFLRRIPPARLAGWDATLRACALGAIPIAHLLDALHIGVYVALLAASSVLHSWGQAGVCTLMARLLPEDAHLAGNAVLSTVGAFSTVVGPLLAAPLIARGGAATAIAVDAGTFAVLAGTFLLAVGPVPAPATTGDSGSGFAVVRRAPALLGLLSTSFVFFFLFGPVYVALPLHVAEDMRGSATLLAAFHTAFGVGAVAGGALTGHLRRLPLWPTSIGIVLAFGGAMLPLGVDAPIPVALASFAAAGALWPPYASLSTTLVQRSAAPAALPAVLAANSSVRVLSVPLGTALAGPSIAAVGATETLLGSALGILVLGTAAAATRLRRRS